MSLRRKLHSLTDCDYVITINTTRNKLVDATFLLSTMPKSRGGRPQGVVHQHAKLSKFHTDDGKVCYYFTCKYCDKAKQTCKPGAPAKIPVAGRLAEHLLYTCAKCPEGIKWPIARAHNSVKIKTWRENNEEPNQSSQLLLLSPLLPVSPWPRPPLHHILSITFS